MNKDLKPKSGNIIYLSHGGGPLPILGDPSHKSMVSFMEKLPLELNKPDAIIVISAHWEESIPHIIGSKNPGLIYDYYGFPKEAYEIKYPAKGNEELAEKIYSSLEKNGIKSKIDFNSGFDHGSYIPLKLMYPKADIPMLQVSLLSGLDPLKHISLGKAIANVIQGNVLMIGSGFSFHNMRAFRFDNSNEIDIANNEFQEWLIDVCTNKNYTQTKRENMLVNWEKAPNARYCHPREEHLMPLHVCLGAASKPAEKIFDDYILGKRAVAFRW